MASVYDICTRIRTILEGLTPHEDAGITFRRAQSHLPLESVEPTASAWETTREFQVRAGAVVGVSHMDGTSGDVMQDITIRVRYQVGGEDRDEELNRLTGSDAAQIMVAVLQPGGATSWNVTGLQYVQVIDVQSTPPEETEQIGIYIQEHTARVQYLLAL